MHEEVDSRSVTGGSILLGIRQQQTLRLISKVIFVNESYSQDIPAARKATVIT